MPRQFNHVFHAGNRQADIGSPDQGAGGDQAHRRKATQGVVTGCGQGGRHRGERRGHKQQGVAVRRLLGHVLGADGTRRTGAVVHHKGAAHDFAQLECHQPAHGVGARTRGEGHHDAHWPVWVVGRILGLGRGLRREQGCGRQGQQSATGQGLDVHEATVKSGDECETLLCRAKVTTV